jgi:hypothetical protein
VFERLIVKREQKQHTHFSQTEVNIAVGLLVAVQSLRARAPGPGALLFFLLLFCVAAQSCVQKKKPWTAGRQRERERAAKRRHAIAVNRSPQQPASSYYATFRMRFIRGLHAVPLCGSKNKKTKSKTQIIMLDAPATKDTREQQIGTT